MRSIKLVFHIGKGKTGTTYIQSEACGIKDICFLGKYYDKQRKFAGGLDSMHYQVFQRYREELKCRSQNPNRSSFTLIEGYGSEIVQQIRANTDKSVFVISDECISDHVNYFGELNTFLVVAIGNHVQKELSQEIKIKKVMSLTIREQCSIIASHFAYSHSLNENFDKWLSNSSNDLSRGYLSGLFYYDLVEKISTLTNGDWDVRVTPYELIHKYPRTFLKEALSLEDDVYLDIDDKPQVIRGNSFKIGNKKYAKNNNFSFLSLLAFKMKLQLEHEGSSSFAVKSILPHLLNKFHIIQCLWLFGRIYDKVYERVLGPRVLQMSQENIDIIKNIYAENNVKLSQIIDESLLKEFGYI